MILTWNSTLVAPPAEITLSTILTLTPGFYTPSTLCGKIQQQVRDATRNELFDMKYGTNDPTASTPSPEIFYNTYLVNVDSADVAFFPMPYNTPAYPYPNTTRQLFDVLGFSALNSDPYPLGNSGTTYCQGTRYVDIVCPQLTYNQPLKDTSSQTIVRDALCRLYLIPDSYYDTVLPNNPAYAPPGTLPQIIYRNFTAPKQISWSPNQPVGQLTFQVYDDCGALLKPYLSYAGSPTSSKVQNNIEWSMTLQVTEN
jgi:hypothetical protein